MSEHRPTSRLFLSRSGITTRPQREFPAVADEPHIVERIATATNLCDEPELVSGVWLSNDNLWEKQRLVHVQAARQARPQLALEDRLKDIQRRARQRNIDLTREVDTMRRDLTRAREGGRRPPKRMTTQLELVEGLLDDVAA